MNQETALAFVEELLFTRQGKPLTHTQREVFGASWENESYEKCAERLNYQADTLRAAGSGLWKLLGRIWDCKVTKKSLKSVVENQWRLYGEQLPSAKNKGFLSVSVVENSQNPTNQNHSKVRKEERSNFSSDPNFVGREEAIAELDRLRERGSKLVQIVAAGGQGKTTLARKYLYARFDHVIEFAIAKETKNVASVKSLLEEKLRQMEEQPGRELMISLERFRKKLQSTEIGILIDNLEPTLDATGCFVEEHRSYLELLRIISDNSLRSFSVITSRESLNEPSISLSVCKPKGLSIESWKKYFRYQLIITEETDKSLYKMHDAFGGNAKAMEILSKVTLQDYDGNIKEYWQKNRSYLLISQTLENLVQEQFKRLQELNLINAYNLLCRLSCYRYQDIPSVTEEGLICLLWDIPRSHHQKTIVALVQRGLVEYQNKEYYLHPVFRSESANRLKNIDSSKIHERIFIFFKEQASIQLDKSHIFYAESLWHFNQHLYNRPQESRNYEVIFGLDNSKKPAKNIKSNILSYANFVTQAAKNTGIFLNDPFSLMDFLKANFYLLQGNSYDSIIYFRKVIENQNSTHGRRITSHLNLVIIYFLLFELDLAYRHSQVVFEYFNENFCGEFENGDRLFFRAVNHAGLFAIKSLVAIDDALIELSKCEYYLETRFHQKHWNSMVLNLELLMGYKNLATQHENTGIQKLFISKAFDSIENMKSRVLSNGSRILSSVLLNYEGELLREQGNLNQALDCHKRSTSSLEKGNTKLFLAESYFQYAMTYKRIGDNINSQKYFDRSLHLWGAKEINAPKQIERVRKAMN